VSSQKHAKGFLKGALSYRVASGFESEVILEYLQSLDCPRALTVAILYRNMEHSQIAELEFNPSLYLTMEACRDAYAATKFLAKFTGLTMDVNLEQVALTKFWKFEALCKQTNRRFRDLSNDPLYKGNVVYLHNAVIRKIESILGDFDAEEFFSMPDWGPGASTLIRRRDASPAKKFQCETGITRDLYDLIPFETLEVCYPAWSRILRSNAFPTYEIGNKVITVPKDASTDRVIAVEPGINLWFQSSIGDMVGKRLRRRGIDLRWQSKNQNLSKEGSKTNFLATIDLSSASDSISSAVVEAILPPRWYHLMDACRSHYGKVGGSSFKWEKFSSMGNGFTFQLESLIFYAVALCCTEYLQLPTEGVSAYGDDVILPSAAYSLFSRCLEFYGFRINVKKSHIDSPFRESCGAHFYLGSDVKPIYLKDRVQSLQSVFRLANAVRRMAHRRNSYGCDSRLRPVFDLLVQHVPVALRLRIPDGQGDGGFVSNFDEASPTKACTNLRTLGWEGYNYKFLAETSLTRYDDTEGYLLASLWSMKNRDDTLSVIGASLLRSGGWNSIFRILGDRTRLKAIRGWILERELGEYNSVPLMGRTRYRLAKGLVKQWYDLGPWI
jgi:hypothetical protein